MHPTVLILLVVTGLVKETQAGAYMEFKASRYSDTCREDFSTSPCDPYFRFCVDRPRTNTDSGWPCRYARTDKSGYFQDTNVIDFVSDIKGIQNPLIVYTSKLWDPSITYICEVYDDDYIDDDYMMIFGTTLTETVYPSKAEAQWAQRTLASGEYHLIYYVRIYCEDNYYTNDCSKHCLVPDTSAGHYTCDKQTGNLICKPGWKGANCNEDINECALNFCQRGDCTNLQGGYSCYCPPNYSGKNCSVYTDPCGSNPCKYNARCITESSSYRCQCNEGWEGDNCDVRTSPCKSMPCKNGMQCMSSADNSSYWCNCLYPTTGVNCESFITSMASSQSPNTSASRGLDTSTAGSVTTTTSTTTARTPDGSNQNGTAQQHLGGATESKDEGFKRYIIVIILIILVLILCAVIILILCIRRRRRAQRNSPAGFSETFDHGAGRLAFENSVYSEPLDPLEKKKNSPLNPVFTIGGRTDAQEQEESKEITKNNQKITKASNDTKNGSKETLGNESVNKDNFLNLKRLTIASENNEQREENHYATVDEMASSVKRLNDNLQKNANQDNNDDDDTSSICSSCISEGLSSLPNLTIATPDQQNETPVYSVPLNSSPDDGTYRTPKSTPA